MSSYDYFSDPTELDARKKVLEYEMEVMGIKKYGEQFTKYDLQELMKNYDHLSRNSQEFLDHIDQGYFITIMNTIADMQTPTEVHWNDVA
jgi:regulator of sigma D